jgi:hypothetical protein
MLITFSLSALAIPAMDAQLDDLMMQAIDVKQSLNLTPNQQTLWRQVEGKMHAIAEARRRRRDQLQSDMRKGVADSTTELRDLAKQFEVEEDLSYQENKQLRELFLTVNDALDDVQRKRILVLLSDQLQRVVDQETVAKCAQPKARGMGRQKSSGAAGNPPQ